jgi:hypothetical protein
LGLHYIGLFSVIEMPRLLSRDHINCPLQADRGIGNAKWTQ